MKGDPLGTVSGCQGEAPTTVSVLVVDSRRGGVHPRNISWQMFNGEVLPDQESYALHTNSLFCACRCSLRLCG